MKKNWFKGALCLSLALLMLAGSAFAAIARDDVAADAGKNATITVADGKLTVAVSGRTQGEQCVLFQVRTGVEGETAQAVLTAAQASTTAPYSLAEDTILYVDQVEVGADGTATFSNFQPMVEAKSLFVLGSNAEGFDAQIIGAMISHGVSVKGTVTAKGAAATDTKATVSLTDSTGAKVAADIEVTLTGGAGTYEFTGVPAGTYTLTVSGTAGKYVAREYAVTVESAEVTQDAVICPRGDASNDGTVNQTDYMQVLNYVKLKGNTTLKDDAYRLACANTNNDFDKTTGAIVVNLSDYMQLLSHVQKLKSLW